MPPSPWFSVAGGFVSPGVVALPADAALGTALATTLPPGVVITTSELTINYLRPMAMKRLAARASVIDSSPFQGLIESSVVDDDGRMVAHLTSRYVTLRAPIRSRRTRSMRQGSHTCNRCPPKRILLLMTPALGSTPSQPSLEGIVLVPPSHAY
jgi:uncharacterized protein (TIGR00369 family)